jgi:hypothetical protein
MSRGTVNKTLKLTESFWQNSLLPSSAFKKKLTLYWLGSSFPAVLTDHTPCNLLILVQSNHILQLSQFSINLDSVVWRWKTEVASPSEASLSTCNTSIWASASSYLYVRPSVRTKQQYSHRTDFHEISYLGIILKFVDIFWWGCNLTKVTEALNEDLRTFIIDRRCCYVIFKQTVLCVISFGGAEGNIKDLDIRIEVSRINVITFLCTGRSAAKVGRCIV